MIAPNSRRPIIDRPGLRLGLLVLAAALLTLPLSGCGRKGQPHAPGPADKIIYPKLYPSE